MTRKIAVLGSGGMGTGCALVLCEKPQHEVWLWSHDLQRTGEMKQLGENRRYLPGIPLNPALRFSSSSRETLEGADLVVVAIPTRFLRETLLGMVGQLAANCALVSVIKGIEISTFLRPSQIIADVLGTSRVATLCGPSHAEEFARRLPCSVVVAGLEAELLRDAQGTFNSDRFRVYTNRDLLGVELAGALKNVVAIAAGISDGLGYGDNAKAGLLSRGLVEMTRFGVALGAEPETFVGLAGMGDLITTCYSPYGRNRRVGEEIGRGQNLAEAARAIHGIPEGVTTCRAVHDLALQRGIDMPICSEVFRVLFEGKSPQAATDSLMNRPPRAEARHL
jgi:glycerol-3-phosphate dehydrogenase (NAD(P)+)